METTKDQSMRLFFQRFKAGSQRRGFELWLKHTSSSVNVMKSQVICGSKSPVINNSNKVYGNVETGIDFHVIVMKMHPNPSERKCGKYVGVKRLLRSVEEDT